MPYYLYQYDKRTNLAKGIDEEHFVRAKNVMLAGNNAFKRCWELKGKPINQGWHSSLDEIVSILTDKKGDSHSHRLIIDFDPTANWRIALIEIVTLYAYTYGNQETGEVWWTPIMLELQDVWVDEELDSKLDKEEKNKNQKQFRIQYREDIETSVEFIYLKGDNGGWTFGRVGGANAPFIGGGARDFFRKYF